jgi:hypothetical protein
LAIIRPAIANVSSTAASASPGRDSKRARNSPASAFTRKSLG